MLAKARHFVPTHELSSIYYSTFSANLSYVCQIWGQRSNPLLKKFEMLQNNAMRIMTFSDYRASTGPIYKSFKVLKLKDQNFLTAYSYMTKFTIRHFLNGLTTTLQQQMNSIQPSHTLQSKANYLLLK